MLFIIQSFVKAVLGIQDGQAIGTLRISVRICWAGPDGHAQPSLRLRRSIYAESSELLKVRFSESSAGLLAEDE